MKREVPRQVRGKVSVSLLSSDVVNVRKGRHRPQKGLTESRYESSHEAPMVESHKWSPSLLGG